MRRSNPVNMLILAICVFFIVTDSLLAVEIYPEDREFWTAFKKHKELDDQREINKLIKRSRKNAEGVLESLTISLCQKEMAVDLDDYEILSQLYKEITGSGKYVSRLAFLKRLTMEQRNERILGYNDYYYGNLKFTEGKTQDNVYTLAEAKDFYTKSIERLQKIGDMELISAVASIQAQCCQVMKDHYEACKALKTALDAMEQLEFIHPDKKWARHEYDKYIAKGYDPTKPRDEGGEPTDAEPKEGEEGAAPQEGDMPEFQFTESGEKTEWPLKFYAMKKFDEFRTPSFHTHERPLLWDQAYLQGNGPMQFKPNLCPINIFGRQVNVVRNRIKLTFDIDAVEKTRQELTMKEKPQPLLLKTLETDAKGRALKYQLFVCHPGSQETVFSLSTNLAPRDEDIAVRTRIGCYVKGKVAGENFLFIDDNTSGLYGDFNTYPEDGITNGEYHYYGTDAVMVGKSKKFVPYSEFLKIGDNFYRIEPDGTGQKITTTEVTTPTGTVSVDYVGKPRPYYLLIHGLDRLSSRNFYEIMGDGKSPVVIPVGKYEIAGGKIMSGKKNKLRQIRIYRGEMKPFFVKDGEETVLELGAPFKYTFETMPMGAKLVVEGKSINVYGKSGEIYTQFFDEIPVPLVSMRIKGTKKLVVKNEPMPLATLQDWYNDQSCAWHPMDFTYDNKKRLDLEVKLETKKYHLLGKPITSDWE